MNERNYKLKRRDGKQKKNRKKNRQNERRKSG